MRLVGLYARAGIAPKASVTCLVQRELCSLALLCFGDRLTIRESGSGLPDWTVAQVGLKGALRALMSGHKLALPYHRAVHHAQSSTTIKTMVSTVGLDFLEALGTVCQPPWDSLLDYQGVSDIFMIPELKTVCPLLLKAQIEVDLNLIRGRMSKVVKRMPSCTIAVFPSGTDMQQMPPEWAKEKLPGATYYFHVGDSLYELFASHGLACSQFDTPEQIAGIALSAHHCVTTDSFPSHILQSITDQCTILLTHQRASVVVHPAFRGSIRHSSAPCSPCIGPRKNTLVCNQGYTQCVAWKQHCVPAAQPKETHTDVH